MNHRMNPGTLVSKVEEIARFYRSIVVNADVSSTFRYVLDNMPPLHKADRQTTLGVVQNCFRQAKAA